MYERRHPDLPGGVQQLAARETRDRALIEEHWMFSQSAIGNRPAFADATARQAIGNSISPLSPL
jgi:hypothetical protein